MVWRCREFFFSKIFIFFIFVRPVVFPIFVFWGHFCILSAAKAAFPPPCFLENRGLEGVWAPPWGVLEGSGRLLGGSWLQEASWVFCRLLSGGSWAAQEPSWGPRWTQVEGQDGSKILPRRPKMSLRCLQDCPRSDFQSKSKEK